MLNKELLKEGLKVQQDAFDKAPPSVEITYREPVCLGSVVVKSSVKIGSYTYFESGRIGSLASIGSYCSVAPDVSIGDGNHPTQFLTTHPLGFKAAAMFRFDAKVRQYKGGSNRPSSVISCPPVIGSDVWVGGGVKILRGVKIGHGSIIGAGSVVNKDVPPFSIVAGAPARVIKYRFDEDTIERLLKLRWWDYDIVGEYDIDFSDIDSAIRKIEGLISSGKLAKLSSSRNVRVVKKN
tara:strand:+ start:11346 stop:12056 length:711 start_codon:yes stop_codon:yes gene_type:complete